jgi:hypothetical protein
VAGVRTRQRQQSRVLTGEASGTVDHLSNVGSRARSRASSVARAPTSPRRSSTPVGSRERAVRAYQSRRRSIRLDCSTVRHCPACVAGLGRPISSGRASDSSLSKEWGGALRRPATVATARKSQPTRSADVVAIFMTSAFLGCRRPLQGYADPMFRSSLPLGDALGWERSVRTGLAMWCMGMRGIPALQLPFSRSRERSELEDG